MKVKLKKDQYYIAAAGGRFCGKKDEIVDIDPLFAKHIRDNYMPVKSQESEDDEKKPQEKPLEKMNKAELTAKIKELELDYSDEDIEAMTKAELIKVIVNAK